MRSLLLVISLFGFYAQAQVHAKDPRGKSLSELCKKQFDAAATYDCAPLQIAPHTKAEYQRCLKKPPNVHIQFKDMAKDDDASIPAAHKRCKLHTRRFDKDGQLQLTENIIVTDIGPTSKVSRAADGSTTIMIYALGGGFLECSAEKGETEFSWCGIGESTMINKGSYDLIKKRPTQEQINQLRQGKELAEVFPLASRSQNQTAWYKTPAAASAPAAYESEEGTATGGP